MQNARCGRMLIDFTGDPVNTTRVSGKHDEADRLLFGTSIISAFNPRVIAG